MLVAEQHSFLTGCLVREYESRNCLLTLQAVIPEQLEVREVGQRSRYAAPLTRRRADATVSICSGVLSLRMRRMRGKRMARPLVWRVLGERRSKAISSTVSGITS